MALSDVIQVRLVRALDEQVPVHDACPHPWDPILPQWVAIIRDEAVGIRYCAMDHVLDIPSIGEAGASKALEVVDESENQSKVR